MDVRPRLGVSGGLDPGCMVVVAPLEDEDARGVAGGLGLFILFVELLNFLRISVMYDYFASFCCCE